MNIDFRIVVTRSVSFVTRFPHPLIAILSLSSGLTAQAGPMVEAYQKKQETYYQYHQKLQSLPATASASDKRKAFLSTVSPAITASAQAQDKVEKLAVKEMRSSFIKSRLKHAINEPLLKTWSENPEKLPKDFDLQSALKKSLKKQKNAASASPTPGSTATPSPTTLSQPKPKFTPADSSPQKPEVALDGSGIPTEIEFEGKKPKPTPTPSPSSRPSARTQK